MTSIRKHRGWRILLEAAGEDSHYLRLQNPRGKVVEEATVYGSFRDALEEGRQMIDEQLAPVDEQEDLLDALFEEFTRDQLS